MNFDSKFMIFSSFNFESRSINDIDAITVLVKKLVFNISHFDKGKRM